MEGLHSLWSAHIQGSARVQRPGEGAGLGSVTSQLAWAGCTTNQGIQQLLQSCQHIYRHCQKWGPLLEKVSTLEERQWQNPSKISKESLLEHSYSKEKWPLLQAVRVNIHPAGFSRDILIFTREKTKQSPAHTPSNICCREQLGMIPSQDLNCCKRLKTSGQT